ncbi:RICIN domain-containing protein [Streptantibioticus silvisoli]|uniref:Glycoside hydrolase family 127 protein n=1 Tax=Streptantibioticus silvisoli TaxID=2705255 RepID=A0ABT6W4A3_9ACTN|nr:RICIN domain-containing protein [Streptantibioticus silvisoli]MDI5965570.1 glycoside hydrolase family 127 protein [Streptantibioticus silvisoli]
MTLSRRRFVTSSVLSAAAVAAAARSATPAAAATRAATGGLYLQNAAPLAPAAFLRLPPGAVTAQGWLSGQLQLQLNGLCGRYQDTSHFLDYGTTGWVTPANVGWEEVPYWLRGYGDLAYVTGDATALSSTERWVTGILGTAQSDGFFGPTSLRTSLNSGPDFWPYLPLIQALRTFQEYSGDSRIVPALTKFFQYMNAQAGSVFASSWVSYRLADALDSVYWLFNRTGDSYLLTLADRMHANGANWAGGIPTPHNVNIAQGFREPALYAVRSGDSSLTQATYHNYTTVMGTYGQFPGGGFAGDENYRAGYTDPRQGFETCGIVEYMASHELLTRVTGDPLWADRCEELAFNSLPAALDPQGQGCHYITSANSVDLNNVAKTQGQFDNTFAMQAYMAGVDQYRCCPHNYGMGWPYFTEELWLATPDNGLAAAMYAPCKVTAKVADGTAVTITETTNYPFADTITLSISTPRALAFPLRLRIPGWCSAPVLQVNGTGVAATAGPAFTVVNRTWNNGDTVTLKLPQQTSIRTWSTQHNAVSVDHGPLTYSLKIGENHVVTGGTSEFPQTEVHATTAWNYGLSLPASNPAGALAFTAASGTLPANPFTPDTAPVSISAPAREITAWVADGERVVTTLQTSPAQATGADQKVTLIPMGAARLRITAFPTVTSGGTQWTTAWFRIRNVNSGKVLGVDQMSTADSANVVQFDDNGTADHLWQLVDDGAGHFRVRNSNSGKVLGVDQMSTADSARVVQFDDSGTADHLWTMVDNGDGSVRIRNVNSGKVLGVDQMSTANSAQVVQFDDSGTADHLWQLL